MKIIITLVIFVLPGLSIGGTITTKVNTAGCSVSKNVCRAVLSASVPGTGCTYSNYVTWSPNSTFSNMFLSVALSAAASNRDVIVTATGPCVLDGQPTLDEIMLKNP